MPNTAKPIVIPKMDYESVIVKIEGMTPLITHRYNIPDPDGGVAKPGKMTPEEQFRSGLYPMNGNAEEGPYGFPAGGIQGAMVSAGGRYTNAKMTVLRGLFSVKADLLEIESAPPTMRTDAVTNRQKGKAIAYRPQFWPWTMEVPLIFNTTLMNVQTILELLQIAGHSIGIGAWRVENNGTFGTFQVVGADGK